MFQRFRSFVLALAGRSPYAERQPFRRHPGLTRHDDGRGYTASGPVRLEFPQRYRDAWHALELVERRLEPAHAEAWRCARLLLRDLAAEMRGAAGQVRDAKMLAVMKAARIELQALAAALGVDHVPLPNRPLVEPPSNDDSSTRLTRRVAC